MDREDERMNLSKYCRQFCPLSDDFPQVAASTGERGGLARGGLVWVNISVAGSELERSGGRPIGQALTAQFHRRTPKEFPRSSEAGAIVRPLFLGFLSSGGFSWRNRERIDNGKKIERFNFDRLIFRSLLFILI